MINMAKSTAKLDIVEQTVLQLLKQGRSSQEVSQILGLPITPIISELAHKKILKPDGSFNSMDN